MKKLIMLLLCGLAWPGNFLLAGDVVENRYFHIHIDEPTIAKGYTVAAFADAIKLSLVPGILSADTAVDIIELHEPLPLPWNLDQLSPVYQFEFRNKEAYEDHRPFYIQLSYPEVNDFHKQVFFYDRNTVSWRPLPTKDFPEEKFVRSLIHLPFARIAVFAYPSVLTVGKASWYAHRGGNFAANPDFPRGSILRVTNQDNGAFIDVEVNDWGPDRGRHPDRPIDLDRTAFARIAPLSQGLASIKVEPLIIKADGRGRVLGVPAAGIRTEPEIDLWAALIMDEDSGEILQEHNGSAILPLASLTKMMSAYVFLENSPDLAGTAVYSSKDAAYNYEWVAEWESARLRLKEGDKVTIQDLLYASLAGSANNTVETLVRMSGRSRPEFIARMNELAFVWGATSTLFVEPTGLAPENVSSVRDYAIISKEVLKNPLIAQISIIPEYSFHTINSNDAFRIRNTNHIIRTANQFNITASKTGYLHESLYCLMTRVVVGSRAAIVVTFGAKTRDDSFVQTADLMRHALRLISKSL